MTEKLWDAFYHAPKVPDKVRFNLRNNPYPPGIEKVEFQQLSGTFTISSLETNDKTEEIISDGTNKFLILLAKGNGLVRRMTENAKFVVNSVPAIFYLSRNQSLQIKGTFTGWIVQLRQTPFNDLEELLPNVEAAVNKGPTISEKIYILGKVQRKLRSM